jgi:hypothetical protein
MSPNVPYNMKNAQGIAPAGTVEEGEYVMDKPVVDKLGPQVLDQLRQKVKTGLITKDQLQSNIAGGDSPSYKCGGMVKRYNKGGLVKSYQLGGIVTQTFKDASDANKVNLSMPTSAPDETIGAAGFTGTLAAPSEQLGFAPFTGEPVEQPETAGVVDTIPPKIPEKPIPSTEERYRGLGMAGLADVAAGEHPLFRTLANAAQQQIAASGAMDTAALRQQMAQMGVTGGAANALMADIQRDIGSERAGAAAATAVAAQKMSVDALKELAVQGQQGMVFEEGKRRFDVGLQQSAMDAALAAGDLDTYAQMYEDIHGTPLDTSTLQNTQNRIMYKQSMQDAQSIFQTNPDTPLEDSGLQMAYEARWQATGHDGPMDQAWAQQQYTQDRMASDPLHMLAGQYDEAGAREFFGGDFVDGYTTTDISGNDRTGWDALRYDFGMMSMTGGMKVDPNTGFVTPDMTNPLVYKVFGQDVTPDYANIAAFTGAKKETGTHVTWAGKEFERTGEGATDWREIGVAGAGGVPASGTYSVDQYSNWKTAATERGALNLTQHKEGLLDLANRGSADAATDLAALYDADVDALVADYETLPQNVKDSISTVMVTDGALPVKLASGTIQNVPGAFSDSVPVTDQVILSGGVPFKVDSIGTTTEVETADGTIYTKYEVRGTNLKDSTTKGFLIFVKKE